MLQAQTMPGPAATQGGPPKGPPPTPFTPRLVLGLVGVLLAVLVAGFNEHVTEIDLADIQGVFGIGHDDGTWITAIYEAANVSAMAFAPWCSVTFSLRRVTLAAIALFAATGAVAPFMPDLGSLYALRALQGVAGGALPPMLMTVALRFLPPPLKVYGLGAYALTATCGPNLGTPLAAFCFDYLGWRTVFWEILPFCAVSAGLVAYGLPQDPMRLERLRLFDWRGFLLGSAGISMVVMALIQGDRLDWFRSPLFCHLAIGGSLCLVLFLVNEWFHPLPFFRIQMLRLRNLSFALIALCGVLVLAVANLELPSIFLADVQGYRPLQIAPLASFLAFPQLLALPLVSALCNLRRVDCRWVFVAGVLQMALSFWGAAHLSSDWYRGNFYLFQALQIFAQPMIVVPILMLATLKLAPMDGPYVSGMFNMIKGLANAVATGLIDYLLTSRTHFHSQMLMDSLGNNLGALTALGRVPANLGQFADAAQAQALTLAISDIYLVLIGITAALFLLLVTLPSRVYPPSSALGPVPAQPQMKTA